MPLDGNDSGATWQGPPTSQSNRADTEMNTPPVPQQVPYQMIQQENTSAHLTFPADTWEPSQEDDFPPEPDENSTPANVTPIRPIPTAPVMPVAYTVGGSVDSASQGVSNTTLHTSQGNVSATTTQSRRPRIAASRATFREQLGHFSSLILIPLLFAVLTGLIILPQVLSSRAYLPPLAFVPLLCILVVIAVAQSVGIYYAGTNNGLWAVNTLTGFFLFVLVGCFALAGAFATLALLVVILILYVALYRLYVHTVPTGFIELVQSSGRYTRILDKGFNILLPWEKTTQPISIQEKPWDTPAQREQFTENEDIIFRGHILYHFDPRQAQFDVLDVNNWEKNLQAIFTARLHDVVNSLNQTFLTTLRSQRTYLAHENGTAPFMSDNRWRQVNDALLQQTERLVSQWGVRIKVAEIQNITLAAHAPMALADDITAPASYIQQNTHTSTTMPEQPKQPTQSAVPVVSAPTTQAAANTQSEAELPASAYKEETLIRAYNMVQNGSIKDPETIRGIAKRFETVANTPALYQNFSFDALRAAYNLLKEADRREEEMASHAGTLFNDETKPDMRKPEDESTYFGA
ncbi:MAG TPA: hypothetical protein DHW02_16275 [Ktedonobacter sp.]|nr:hypothetical protein [Ktedonobacter sp.]